MSWSASQAFLLKADRRMANLVARVGPVRIPARPGVSPFEALVESIIYQQLTGKAAATILGRVTGLFPDHPFPRPEDLLEIPVERLRGAGVSRSKVMALKDLSEKTLAGLVPTRRQMARMDDEDIVECLTAVRGVGRWTVEMLLIFLLARKDVFPAGDLGVRKGFALVYGLKDLPAPKKAGAWAEEHWSPHRTAAAWYLWRATELGV